MVPLHLQALSPQARRITLRTGPRGPESTSPSPPSLDIVWGQPMWPKRQRIAIVGNLAHRNLEIRLTGSPGAIAEADHHLFINPGIEAQLARGLASGLTQAVHAVRLRGRHRMDLAQIKRCAAVAYVLLQNDWPSHLRPVLERAEAALAKGVGERTSNRVSDNPRERAIMLAAFLVRSAFSQEWKELGRKDPRDGDPESFFKRYIKPGLAGVQGTLSSPLAQFDLGRLVTPWMQLGAAGRIARTTDRARTRPS